MEKLRQEEIHRGMKKMQEGAKTKSVKKVNEEGLVYFVEEEYEEEKVKVPVRTVLGCGKMAEMLLQKYPLQRYPWTRDSNATNTLGKRLEAGVNGSTGVGQPLNHLAIENGDPTNTNTNTLGRRLEIEDKNTIGLGQPLAIENGDHPQGSGDIYTFGSGRNSGTSTPKGSGERSSSRGMTLENGASISSWGTSSSRGGSNKGRDLPHQTNLKLRSQQPLQLPLQIQPQPQPQLHQPPVQTHPHRAPQNRNSRP